MIKIFIYKHVSKILIKPILKLHSFTYKLSGTLAAINNNGIHPKHHVMKYKEWFLDNIKTNWTILDIGCNTGMMTKYLSEKAKYVYGIDIITENIKVAEQNIKKENIEFICADATTYDFSKCRAIDCVILSNVLEHIENRENFLKKLVFQIKWNNKKRFLIRVPMIDREWIVLYKKELGLDFRLDPTHYIEYTFRSFEEELNNAGITIKIYQIRFGEIYAICDAR